MRLPVTAGIAAILTLSACSSSEDEGTNAAIETNGTVSISAPGFNMSVDLPAEVTKNIEISTDSEALFPGANANGIRMSRDEATGTDRVNVDFSTKEGVEEVAKWYGNPSRSRAFRVTGINVTNGVQTMSVVDDSGEPFNVILKPGENGGTSGTLRFRGNK